MNRFFALIILTLNSILSLAQEQFSAPPDFFRKERRLPLTELNTLTTMNVSSFGAVVNDEVDDLQGINDAIAAAIAQSI